MLQRKKENIKELWEFLKKVDNFPKCLVPIIHEYSWDEEKEAITYLLSLFPKAPQDGLHFYFGYAFRDPVSDVSDVVVGGYNNRNAENLLSTDKNYGMTYLITMAYFAWNPSFLLEWFQKLPENTVFRWELSQILEDLEGYMDKENALQLRSIVTKKFPHEFDY